MPWVAAAADARAKSQICINNSGGFRASIIGGSLYCARARSYCAKILFLVEAWRNFLAYEAMEVSIN